MNFTKHVMTPLARCIVPLLISYTVVSAFALGPHEVLLLVNTDSERSKEVAHQYAALRKIPDQNIIYLALPSYVLEAEARIAPQDYTRHIWNPVTREIRSRKIGNHILAWIYSVDFPVRVMSTPPMSLQGMTFIKNQLLPAETIKYGRYISPLFTGPQNPGARRRQEQPCINLNPSVVTGNSRAHKRSWKRWGSRLLSLRIPHQKMPRSWVYKWERPCRNPRH